MREFRRFIVVVFALGLAACSGGRGIPDLAPSTGPLDDLLAAHDGFSGVVLLGAGDSVLFSNAYGLADDDSGRGMTTHEVWRWCSVTKQLVAVLVMQEVEAGRLDLDWTLSRCLPGLDVETADRITVRQLLQHTSGLANPDSIPGEVFRSSGGFDPDTFCAGPPDSAPGAGFRYNNCDYHVLARILERSAGRSWESLLRERILTPARMSRSGVFDGTPVETVTAYMTPGVVEPPIDVSIFGAAGAIFGVPEDLLRFNAALLDGRLLGDAARELLFTGDPSLGYVALGAWSFEAPLAGCEGTVRLIERRGGIGGVNVRNILAPDLSRSLVVFVNRGAFDFGEIWMKSGLAYEMTSLAFCASG